MKQNPQQSTAIVPYNKVVREAYQAIYRKAKQLLATLENEEVRYSLEREDKSNLKVGSIIHEFINPLLYLRLECYPNNLLAIHYGFEQALTQNEYSELTSIFIRSIYYLTSKEYTEVNVEQAVRTDWCINNPSELYAHVEECNKHHTFKQIAYKPATTKRKQMLKVA